MKVTKKTCNPIPYIELTEKEAVNILEDFDPKYPGDYGSGIYVLIKILEARGWQVENTPNI